MTPTWIAPCILPPLALLLILTCALLGLTGCGEIAEAEAAIDWDEVGSWIWEHLVKPLPFLLLFLVFLGVTGLVEEVWLWLPWRVSGTLIGIVVVAETEGYWTKVAWAGVTMVALLIVPPLILGLAWRITKTVSGLLPVCRFLFYFLGGLLMLVGCLAVLLYGIDIVVLLVNTAAERAGWPESATWRLVISIFMLCAGLLLAPVGWVVIKEASEVAPLTKPARPKPARPKPHRPGLEETECACCAGRLFVAGARTCVLCEEQVHERCLTEDPARKHDVVCTRCARARSDLAPRCPVCDELLGKRGMRRCKSCGQAIHRECLCTDPKNRSRGWCRDCGD